MSEVSLCGVVEEEDEVVLDQVLPGHAQVDRIPVRELLYGV